MVAVKRVDVPLQIEPAAGPAIVTVGDVGVATHEVTLETIA